jgi:hypothetical protein
MNEILTYCPACDATHGPDCPADPFGPAETITVGLLAAGDFVVAIPAQAGTRGTRANSGVREISAPNWDRWTSRSRPRGPRMPVASRRITFLDRALPALEVPCTYEVIVRRRRAA